MMGKDAITAAALARMFREWELTPAQFLDNVFARIEKRNPVINAFVSLSRDSAYRQAEKVGELLAAGEKLHPLAGVPVAVKDNICTMGLKTTCCSKMLENFIPPYNASAVEKMLAAGMVVIGKTNLDEFAMGSSTETSFFGPARNPYNTDFAPGGSSGGSAAAVADSQAVLAVGSDTGGSIRQPSSMCGVTGLKPTYGTVSRYGLVAFASSLDQIGPIARSVEDAAALLGVLSGFDPRDGTSIRGCRTDYSDCLSGSIKGLTLGLPDEYMGEGIAPEVRERVMEAAGVFEKSGAKVKRMSLPHTDYAVSAYYIIATAEASSNLARFDGVKYGYRAEGARSLSEMYFDTRSEGFGPEVKRRIMLGAYVLSAGYYDEYYLKAQKARTLIKNDFDECFKDCDCLITPTCPSPAFMLGEKTEDPLQMYLTDICTIPVNLAGLPAVTVPVRPSSGGVPVGLQIIGRQFGEDSVLRFGSAYQRETGWHLAQPGE